jgi:hypothetical protein
MNKSYFESKIWIHQAVGGKQDFETSNHPTNIIDYEYLNSLPVNLKS